jgi:hypothetical protein
MGDYGVTEGGQCIAIHLKESATASVSRHGLHVVGSESSQIADQISGKITFVFIAERQH